MIIDHDTHGHRLGQYKAQTGFEGSQEAGSLDEEVAIASTPSSVQIFPVPVHFTLNYCCLPGL